MGFPWNKIFYVAGDKILPRKYEIEEERLTRDQKNETKAVFGYYTTEGNDYITFLESSR